MSNQFTFAKCMVPQEGAILYKNGEQILRTVSISQDISHHNTIAKTVTDLLNAKFGTSTSTQSSYKRSSAEFDPDWLDKLLSKAQDHQELSDKEHGFVEDMLKRFGKYQEKTLISTKQLEWLQDIDSRINDG